MLECELNAGIGKLVPLSRLINRRESAFHFEIQTNQWIPLQRKEQNVNMGCRQKQLEAKSDSKDSLLAWASRID